jgi:hypothetical protein
MIRIGTELSSRRKRTRKHVVLIQLSLLHTSEKLLEVSEGILSLLVPGHYGMGKGRKRRWERVLV